ncbi:MAG: glutamate--cysteine ligase GshA [Gammaproteobacteria bacterium]|nr:glutamate--cysteine ligase GshA [Gammaproteobacteria bacterium]
MSTIPAYPAPGPAMSLSGPLLEVEKRILERMADIEAGFRCHWRKTPAPFYASVDLRNAGFKIAPVDTNLFPAGFNNLNPDYEPLCIQAVQQAVALSGVTVDRILIVPENHTRNLFYLESVAVLQEIIERAGFAVRIGSIIPGLETSMRIELKSGRTILLEPLQRNGDEVHVGDFRPDLVLLNNDMSAGIPAILEEIKQTVTPALQLGWSHRLKSVHFGHYQQVASEFAQQLDIDPWLIDPMFRNCGEVDFMAGSGISCLTRNIETLLTAIRKKYEEYQVSQEPFVMVKADAGTYGMGVMTVHRPDDVIELNRKQRTRMATTKEGQKITRVIIQEGVYTRETWGEQNFVAEPVIYMIGQSVVGGFYRVHSQRAINENLNSPGMRFERLAFDDCCIAPDKHQDPDAHPNRFYTYGVIARLALLAAARERASLG